jgi:hypothetical protein
MTRADDVIDVIGARAVEACAEGEAIAESSDPRQKQVVADSLAPAATGRLSGTRLRDGSRCPRALSPTRRRLIRSDLNPRVGNDV